MEKLVERTRVDAQKSCFFIDKLFVDHVNRDIDCGRCGALAGPGLKHPKLFVLDRELNVLHVLIMFFKPGVYSHKIFIS